jgi:transcriptional regulator with XRE-family HTH domain
VSTRERPVDRGTRLGRAALERVGRELRDARIDRGLSIDVVAAVLGISNAELSRIERALSPRVPYVTLVRCAAVVGLDLVVRTYPGPAPLRDAPQASLLGDFRGVLSRSLRFATEVPFPIPGDQRAWDGMIMGIDWRFGVEAETAPRDAQALARRLALKLRDGEVDGLVLIVRDGPRVRDFLTAGLVVLQPLFQVPPRRALASLRAGLRPPGNAIIPIRRSSPPAHTPRV